MSTVRGCTSVSIGMVVTVSLAALVDGGLSFVAIAIICTAGIGLVGWIPLWWAVGRIILAVLEATHLIDCRSSFRGRSPSRSSPLGMKFGVERYP